MRTLRAGFLSLSLCLLVLSACGKKAEREWSPADHDRLDENPSGPQQAQRPQQPQQPNVGPVASAAAGNAADVYRTTCAPCHGATGRGDGPAGRALRAPDLTQQGRMTDEQMATVIKNGRGQMPAYGSFPPELVTGLVKHIRTLK